jgi:hypothetical protein
MKHLVILILVLAIDDGFAGFHRASQDIDG